MNYLDGKIVAITGAGSGFGRLIACKAAALGARIAASDVNADAVAETAAMIKAAGGECLTSTADVTNAEAMKAWVTESVAHYGRIDVMTNNAGIMPLAFYSDHEKAASLWDKCIDINIKGVLNGICAVHDQMLTQGQGHIVNVSSIYGNYPVKGAAVYGATKAAVNFMSEALRQESQGKIKVTTVRPTGIPTTGIAGSIVNFEAAGGIMGSRMAEFGERFGQMLEGKGSPGWSDPESIEYLSMEPEHLAQQVIYAMNQPWGVSIGDITVRASGDYYVI